MGLGGVGVTLQDLVQLYSGIPRLGTTRPLREIIDVEGGPREPMRLMDQAAAWQVGNVLMGTPPRKTPLSTGSHSRPEPATAIAMPGR